MSQSAVETKVCSICDEAVIRVRDAGEPGMGIEFVDLPETDLARILASFRGQPVCATSTMRYVRAPADGLASAYVFDEDSGMVYILD